MNKLINFFPTYFNDRGYIKRLMRETGEEIEELTNEIRHDIEVFLHTIVLA